MAIRRAARAAVSVLVWAACVWFLWRQHFHGRIGVASLPEQHSSDLVSASDNKVELVVASMRRENTAWVHKHLPNWRKSVYVVDNPRAKLTVSLNKGRESMVYLTFVRPKIPRLPSLQAVQCSMHKTRTHSRLGFQVPHRSI
jgi:hypothetical protein